MSAKPARSPKTKVLRVRIVKRKPKASGDAVPEAYSGATLNVILPLITLAAFLFAIASFAIMYLAPPVAPPRTWLVAQALVVGGWALGPPAWFFFERIHLFAKNPSKNYSVFWGRGRIV